MTVVNPADGEGRLVVGGENVSGLVGELVARRKNGDAGAVAGGGTAVAAEHDGLELAIGGDGLDQIVVAAEVVSAREKEVDEKSAATNRQQQDAADNEMDSFPGGLHGSWKQDAHGACCRSGVRCFRR